MIRKVKVENGWVRGLPAADPRITSYKGIPFADKPIGKNRWRAPQPCPDWEGELFAAEFGPIAMQANCAGDPAKDIYAREWAVDADLPMSEDCLYLNVWAPADGRRNMPVYVWYFGGGLQVGNTTEMEFDGERLARRGIVVVTVGYRQKGCMEWAELLERAQQVPLSEVHRLAANVNKDDVCNMQYTSGTTGFPKGVMLTHYNVVNNGKAIGDCMDLSTADRMMIQVPMFHCFGMVLAMTASMTHAVTMSPIPAFSPRRGLDCINKEKITCFHGVPTMFIAMLGHEDFDKTDFSHMRTGIMAGSPCPIQTMREVIEKMHMPEICITYGQTEASPATTMSKTTDSIETRVNTVGGPIFGVECKIVDPETGEELPDNVDGEFVARGYNIMKGYYKMPAATAAAIDSEGWLHSGDLARRTPEGYFKITGRIKDMIIRGGENLYPKEIEDFIYTHPDVKDVQVIGVPDKQYGEEAMACVIPKEDSGLTEEKLREFIVANIAKHKVPKYIAFVDSFPMNAAGKILKYKMREWAVEYLNLQADSKIETA